MLDREAIVEEILQRQLSAIIRTHEQQLAADAMQAAVDGGFRMVEFTLTTPGALDLINQFAANPQLLVGAGTVLNADHAIAAINAGARFLVSPVVSTEMIDEARALGVPSIPGTFTPTEMQQAHTAGADFCKLFPAPYNLPQFIRSVLGPLPQLRIFPTNGVTPENVRDVLAAGAVGAGFVQALFDPNDLATRNFGAITKRAQAIVATVFGG